MPCFCLISGHLSPTTLDARRARGLFQLFAVFVIFQTLYYLNAMLAYRLNGFSFPWLPVQVFAPPGPVVTWFLLALLIWRLSAPLLARAHAPVLLSVLVGLSALFLDLGVNYQNILSLSLIHI